MSEQSTEKTPKLFKLSEPNDLILNPSSFNSEPSWTKPLPKELIDINFINSVNSTRYFD